MRSALPPARPPRPVGAGALLVATLALTACTAPSPDDHAAVVRRIFEQGWSEGRVEALGDGLAPEIRFHYGGATRRTSAEDLGAVIGRWRQAFPDLRMEIRELVADGDIVAARLRLTGTHEGEWLDVPATGRHVRMDLMMFFRFEAGELVEVWEVDDQLHFRQQLGLDP